MNDAEIFYKAINVLVDRELKVKAMTSRAIADALMLALSKLIETAPDVAQQKELRSRVALIFLHLGQGLRAITLRSRKSGHGEVFGVYAIRSIQKFQVPCKVRHWHEICGGCQ